jgi:hypothetical protein
MYLIQGFFCQVHTGLGTGYAPGMGTVATIETGTAQVMFAGLLQRDRITGRLSGEMIDPLGGALLDEVRIGSNEVSFVKRYQNRSRNVDIVYTLRRGPLLWVGDYTIYTPRGDTVKGPVHCVLTEVADELFKAYFDRFTNEVRAQQGMPGLSNGPDEALGEDRSDLGEPPF